MEIIFQFGAIGGAAIFGVGTLIYSHHRDIAIWICCFGLCLIVIGLAALLQDYHWKKDLENKRNLEPVLTKETVKEAVKEAVREALKEQAEKFIKTNESRLDAQYSLGYASFEIETKRLAPLTQKVADSIKVDWPSAKVVSTTSNSVTMTLPNILISNPQIKVRNFRMSGNSITIPFNDPTPKLVADISGVLVIAQSIPSKEGFIGLIGITTNPPPNIAKKQAELEERDKKEAAIDAARDKRESERRKNQQSKSHP